jgi:threonine dehydrogenase-like Zn-dependent dehydrogenase
MRLTASSKNTMGQNIAASFGLFGGYDGLQAEHARVPLADFNLLKLPDSVSDESAIMLSDILCTAWHGLQLAEVDQNTNSLCIWGAGPVGLLAVQLAKFIGVQNVFCIDHHDYRLQRARAAGAEPLNFDVHDISKTLLAKYPTGIEKCIDYAGFRFSTSLSHKFQRAVGLETDSPDIIAQMINVCKSGGNIALIGEYIGTANAFPIGPLMEKGITLRGGHVWVQSYWDKLLALLESKLIDPTIVISHQLDFGSVVDAYKALHDRQDGSIKILLKTKYYNSDLAKRAHFAYPPVSTLPVEQGSQKL